MQIVNYFFIILIRVYQYLFKYFPKVCRFTPSCSNYALEAFRKYNVFKAFFLTCWRILRCNPFCAGGYDPVP